MNVPNDHPELLGLLAGVLMGGPLEMLHDWLAERGDWRAEGIATFLKSIAPDEVSEAADAIIADLMHAFQIEPCQQCSMFFVDKQPDCQECHGLGWSRLITAELDRKAKIVRFRTVDPKRVPLV